MKLRKLKYYHCIQMESKVFLFGPIARARQAVSDWRRVSIFDDAELDKLLGIAETPTAATYKVARVKDDVVVLETESEAEAQEAIAKAAKQKKAKLHLVNAAVLAALT